MPTTPTPPPHSTSPGAFARLLSDGSWADQRLLSPAAMIGLATFGILALELALIRWTSSQVRVFAYFNNLVLIGTFLGMGLGVALGRRRPGLVHLLLPALLLVALPFALSDSLGLVHLKFPDRSVSLWGGEKFDADWGVFVRSLAVFLSLFTGIVAVFACAGAALGHLFPRLPTLKAYTADLVGSLVGILAFSFAAWLHAGPAVWLALGVLPFLVLTRGRRDLVLAMVVVLLGYYSVQEAVFSPYNRIAMQKGPVSLELEVNRDFHQYLHDFSPAHLNAPNLHPDTRKLLQDLQRLYALPFVLNAQRTSAVVVGAGTGNDVQAALRAGYQRVTSVDIDPRIIEIGRQSHPEHPYSNPGVRTVVDDARSFFGSDVGTYDVVCFGLLDSHAMASAMSTLRLDNYVYTEEGIRAAWQHVAPRGHLSLAISTFAGRWFFERLYWTITRATGREPIAFYSPLHGTTVTYIVPKPGAALVTAEIESRQRLPASTRPEDVLTPSDDWPFLYVRPGAFPWGYLVVLAFVLALAAATVPRAFEMRRGLSDFDGPLFLMGAAFLLIETRGVTSMSLLFGSTWIVNAVIFSGILLMVLVANLVVQRWTLRNPAPWFIGLFAAMVLLYLFPVAWIQALPLASRILLAGLITGLPVGFAGLIVPMLLARSPQPTAALGSNLLGAVLGGCLEYYSMLGGLKSTALMALVLYLAAFLWLRRPATPRTATAA